MFCKPSILNIEMQYTNNNLSILVGWYIPIIDFSWFAFPFVNYENISKLQRKYDNVPYSFGVGVSCSNNHVLFWKNFTKIQNSILI